MIRTSRNPSWNTSRSLVAAFVVLCIASGAMDVDAQGPEANPLPGEAPARDDDGSTLEPALTVQPQPPEEVPAEPTEVTPTQASEPSRRGRELDVPEAKQVPYTEVAPPPPPPELVSYRKLGDHHFPLAVFVPPALTFNYFGVRAGIEYHSVPGYSRDLSFFGEGNYSPATLKTINAAETVDAALRLHEYLALVGSAYGLARVGANVPTLLGTGADYTYGGDLGVLVKLFRIAGFQMAIRAQAGYYAGQQAGIIELFQDIGGIVQNNINELAATQNIADVDLPGRLDQIENSIRVATTAMLTPFRGFQYGGSLNMAQGLGSAFGLQLSAGLYGKSATYDIPVFDARTSTISTLTRTSDRLWPQLGVAFDAYLGDVFMPLSLVAEWTMSRMSVKSDLPDELLDRHWWEHMFALGVHYAELLDLQLGVTGYITYGRDPLSGANAQAAGKPLDVGGQFVFRFTR